MNSHISPKADHSLAATPRKFASVRLSTDRRGNVDFEKRLTRIKKLAQLMDQAFLIPGTGRRVGLDSLIGLIPGVGDLATTAASGYIVREAWLLGLPKRKMAQMIWNIAVDAVVGSVPLLGDLFDIAFKSNTRNVKLIEAHLDLLRPASSDSAE